VRVHVDERLVGTSELRGRGHIRRQAGLDAGDHERRFGRGRSARARDRQQLIEDDPRFGGRGRPSFLVTTASFLRALGLDSIAKLPPLPGLPPTTVQPTTATSSSVWRIPVPSSKHQ
jgi:hypothetical protein